MTRKGGADPLAEYNARRRFDETPEPPGGRVGAQGGRTYTIQKHDATRLHYDLRLELDGVLKSWAITRGPSLDPADKRLAVRTEDHPLDYAQFEGIIPKGYGAGTVMLWDRGEWEPLADAKEGLRKGKLSFRLFGERLRGKWALVRMRGKKKEKRENWLLIKERDSEADQDATVTEDHTDSIASGRAMDAIAEGRAAKAKRAAPSTGKTATATEKKGRGRKSALPAFRKPALATLSDALPEGEDWLFEVKFDGYRALAAADGDEVRLYTRSGLDWTDRFASLAAAIGELGLSGVLLDGEVAVTDARGRSDFAALQLALKDGKGRLLYFVFDLLVENGKDLSRKPLSERKERLRELLGTAGRKGPVFYTDHVAACGEEMLDALCDRGFEGVIAKRADHPYRAGRGRSWLKIKCGHEQEFVVIGWSKSTRNRPFSSILLAVHEDGGLRYAGRVGTGFSDAELRRLSGMFRKLDRKTPAAEVPAPIARNARWVRPELVAQVAFAEFTADGLVRQGRYLGLREDKPARAVVRETPMPVEEAEMTKSGDDSRTRVCGVTLSHPDKVLYAGQGVTKQDLARYLERASARMMPHVEDRFLTLLRCPAGRSKKCFFQRHAGSGMSDEFHTASGGSSKDENYVYITNPSGLIAAAQMGVLEMHIWGSRIDRVMRPDRLVFDLDPDPSVEFAEVKRAAKRLRDVLGALELESFAMLTGGKGIHVVVPIRRDHEWPTAKAFCRGVAERLAEDAPDRFVATMSKARRKGRIFIDFFRNDRAATAIAPYSPRAREGAPVAWPIAWEALDRCMAANVYRLPGAIDELDDPDPWEGYGAVNQALKAAALAAVGADD